MRPVALSPAGPAGELVDSLVARAPFDPAGGVDISATLEWCVEVASSTPHVGDGHTIEVWNLLAATAARDVTMARVLEPHLDARSILQQADVDSGALATIGVDDDSTWGVFAAEPPHMRVVARHHDGQWMLSGTKAWCSLAQHLTHALVTAYIEPAESDDSPGSGAPASPERRLFAVDLRTHHARAHDGPWHARGMAAVVSAPVDFDAAPAVAIGPPGWYLTRPGFAWGGMSVAACWWGAAAGIAEALVAPARSARADQLALVHLGQTDAALWAARAVLAEAATLIDSAADNATSRTDAALLAARVRTIVADAATRVLSEADAALGPAPLVADQAHARRVADLHLYLRQHHGLRDVARIGRDVIAQGPA